MKTARLFVLAALMVSIGGQWMALQSLAWVGMAVSYSMESGSVRTGLGKTFDGEHPCPLCKAVQKGSQEENDSTPSTGGKKPMKCADQLCEDAVLCLYAPAAQFRAVDWMQEKAKISLPAPEEQPPRTV